MIIGLDTIIMEISIFYDISRRKRTPFALKDFSDEDGIRAGELREYWWSGGWGLESDAFRSKIGFRDGRTIIDAQMGGLTGNAAQDATRKAFLGKPDIILLDEPTNNLDIRGGLVEFLMIIPEPWL